MRRYVPCRGTAAVMLLMLLGLAGPVVANDTITLRLHQFLPTMSTVPAKILRPWAERIEAVSDGRLRIEHFDSMTLGGRPPELYDQARDGVVDLVMTLPGYTPGRFPHVEVFELPFFVADPVAASRAFWTMQSDDWPESAFPGVKILGTWVHGPGIIHARESVDRLEALDGLKVRGPTRIINELLGALGAVPVGMPLPSVPEALSRGVIDASVVPWEVTPSIRLSELVDHHTEFDAPEGLYTATFIVAMNRARYERLPEDLRAILDRESGAALSAFAAEQQVAGDAPARRIATDAGNEINILDAAETARWKAAAEPVYRDWIDDVGERGLDGEALIQRARGLMGIEPSE